MATKGRKSDDNRVVIYADASYRAKIDTLAAKVDPDLAPGANSAPGDPTTNATDLSGNRSKVVRAAIDELYGKFFPESTVTHPFGLAEVLYPANRHDYNAVLASAQDLTLVFNDMKRWLPRHLDTLRQRFKTTKRTRIFLLHPNNPYLAPIADVSQKILNVQRGEIGEAVRFLCDGLWDALDGHTIYGHRRFNTFSGLVTEDAAMAVYYPINKRYNDDYIHVYRRTNNPLNIHQQFVNDADELQRDCEQNVPDYDLVKLFRPADS
jgi:hypothetical protein